VALSLISRAALVGLGLLLVAAGCQDDAGDPAGVTNPPGPGGGEGGFGGSMGGTGVSPWAGRDGASLDFPARADGGQDDSPDADPASFNCPEAPTAYLLSFADPFTMNEGSATELLAQAGFNVQPLPLDRNPAELDGVIFFGSFVSEHPAYGEYVKRNAVNLYTFVDRANMLVQLSQADQREASPPFLPSTKNARRHDLDLGKLYAFKPQSPLLKDVPVGADRYLTWQFPQLGWETFASQGGFEVVLAGGSNAANAALMEGAYGQGRIILAAMAPDKPVGAGPDRDQFNQAFFRNLFQQARDVCRRQAPPLEPTPSSSQPAFGEGGFMLAVLPDTQVYSLLYPGIYTAQTAWIASHIQERRIPYVLHLGDIVDTNTHLEWRRAAQAMSLLEGLVPYALSTGNHDYGPAGNAANRDTLLNQYFSYERTAAWPTFGGAYEVGKLDNTYHLFTAGGRDYIIISLEWGPRDQVITWADQIMAQNPTRFGILITHAYLNNNDRRYDHTDTMNPQAFIPQQYGTAGGVNDGEQLWQKLVRKYPFVMVLNGHVLGDGTGYRADVTDRGNTCHQMLSNYQFRNLGGEGYMRLLEFLEDAKTVRVYTYSPLYDSFLNEPDQSYTFTLDVGMRP
jgi:3',5'-cyclic AMP phosphodiesterase CpdA